MTAPQYTRYTLRLGPAAAAADADASASASAPAASAPASAASASAAPAGDPPDDWSGAPSHPAGPDPEALDYRRPDVAGLILELQPAGWQEEEDGEALTFWLEQGAEAGDAVSATLRRLGRLGRLEVSRERPGWEDAWRRFHKPHVVGRLYVRPPWYPPRDDLLDIVVEAGLAFGTGGHASTRLCLEEIQTIPPGSLLDLGSGSGVVSFAALRLGFSPVWGVDIDPVAVHSAAGNAAMNDLSPTFVVGDATDPAYPIPEADTVVANIALKPILRLAERWRDGGPAGRGAGDEALPRHLLLSGLLLDQGEQAAAAFPWAAVQGRRDDGTWLMLHLVRRS